MKRRMMIVAILVGVCAVFLAVVAGKRGRTHVATAECVATMPQGGGFTVDVGHYIEQTMELRRSDIAKEAYGIMLSDVLEGEAVIQDACAALVAVAVSVVKVDPHTCRVVASASARSAEAAALAAHCTARAFKAVVDGEEDRRCDKTLEEIHLNALKSRIRIDELEHLRQLVDGSSPQFGAKIGDALREAKERLGKAMDEEGNVRRALSEDRIRIEVLAQPVLPHGS